MLTLQGRTKEEIDAAWTLYAELVSRAKSAEGGPEVQALMVCANALRAEIEQVKS